MKYRPKNIWLMPCRDNPSLIRIELYDEAEGNVDIYLDVELAEELVEKLNRAINYRKKKGVMCCGGCADEGYGD